jgi:tripartite-type tricarboxylate transporter receptor subunit TctC
MIPASRRTRVIAAAQAVAFGLAAASWVSAYAAEQSFPTRPIRLIASTTAASQPDMIARTIGQKMSESWGGSVVVDNRPGGGGILGASTVAKATPDGHTLLYAIPNFVITPVLQANVPYSLKDFECIGQVGYSTNLMVAAPSLGAKSVKELIAAAKSQPGKLVFASSATGSAAHLSGARFNHVAGIKVVHVSFKGGPEAAIEVLGGRAHYHVGTMGVLLPFIKEGKLVPLAVMTPQRASALPDTPSLGELLPEFKRPDTSHALLAPAGTPRAIVNRINKELVRILDLPDVKERMHTIDFNATPGTPQECAATQREQFDVLAKVVTAVGLKPK